MTSQTKLVLMLLNIQDRYDGKTCSIRTTFCLGRDHFEQKKIKTDIGEIGDDDADQVPSFTIVTNGGLL